MDAKYGFDVRLSSVLMDQLHDGAITPSMLLTMTCLYNWANWDTGIVKHVSAGGLETWTHNAFSERTFSESLRKLEWMGWITRHHRRGSHKSYAVTVHNYKVTDDAGKVQVINPRDIVTYESFPSGSRDEASSEGSDDASDETSDRTNLKTILKNKSQNQSENYKGSKEVSKGAPPTATLSDSPPEKNNPDELGVGEQEQVKSKVTEWQERSGSMDDIFTVGNLWLQYTQHPASYEVAAQLLLIEGTCELVTKYMTIILAKNPKTAKIAWTDMEFYLSKYDDIEDGSGKALFTGNRTKALTWLRSQEAKKATA